MVGERPFSERLRAPRWHKPKRFTRGYIIIADSLRKGFAPMKRKTVSSSLHFFFSLTLGGRLCRLFDGGDFRLRFLLIV